MLVERRSQVGNGLVGIIDAGGRVGSRWEFGAIA